jgi:SAM-dependent methyltransferase
VNDRAARPLSFRDPSGAVVEHCGQIYRLLTPQGAVSALGFLDTDLASDWIRAGSLARAEIVEQPPFEAGAATHDAGGIVLRHDHVGFASYPFEWPAPMLYEAGLLTLAMARSLFDAGWHLKDATPYNVMFRHTQPVFIDWGSFVPPPLRSPIWPAYGQFVRTFLLPLLLERFYGIAACVSLSTSRDGVNPADVIPLLRPWQCVRPLFISNVVVPALLKGGTGARPHARTLDQARARYQVLGVVRHLERAMRSVQPDAARRGSAWTDYAEQGPHADAYLAAKRAAVGEWLHRISPARLLDLGCNSGQYSVMAAAAGADVVAVDGDPAVVAKAFIRARDAGATVLPLVHDLAWGASTRGWPGLEVPGFFARAHGRFDTVLCLALLHHLRVIERIPLRNILCALRGLGAKRLILEFVPPEDPQAAGLMQRTGEQDLESERGFAAECSRHLRIVERTPLPGSGRVLYLLESE